MSNWVSMFMAVVSVCVFINIYIHIKHLFFIFDRKILNQHLIIIKYIKLLEYQIKMYEMKICLSF